MKKLILTIKENWKDPVWSKVIAATIISIAGLILSSIYALIESLYQQISFLDSFFRILEILNKDVNIKTWLFILAIVVYVILVSNTITKFLVQLKNRKTSSSSKKDTSKIKIELPRATEQSTSLFSYRIASAFPGVRDIAWFNNPSKAIARLEILLKKPIRFSSSSRDYESDPIWWFRGSSDLYIDKFERINKTTVLMGIKQLKIKRIAAYHGDSYYLDFVYVETEAEKPTGLYNYNKDELAEYVKNRGYSSEEYGIITNFLGWKRIIHRDEYEDGATVVRGKVKDASKAELRTRFTSKYNFIIAAKGSPFNSVKFRRESNMYFNGILSGKMSPNDLFDFMKKFNKHEQ